MLDDTVQPTRTPGDAVVKVSIFASMQFLQTALMELFDYNLAIVGLKTNKNNALVQRSKPCSRGHSGGRSWGGFRRRYTTCSCACKILPGAQMVHSVFFSVFTVALCLMLCSAIPVLSVRIKQNLRTPSHAHHPQHPQHGLADPGIFQLTEASHHLLFRGRVSVGRQGVVEPEGLQL